MTQQNEIPRWKQGEVTRKVTIDTWTCDACGFTMDATHRDDTSTSTDAEPEYSCPVCELQECEEDIKECLHRAEQEREYKVERYLLTHPDHDPFQLRVINSVNLPNNPEFDDLIEEWLVNNYGNLDGWKYYCLSLTKMRTIGADTDAPEH